MPRGSLRLAFFLTATYKNAGPHQGAGILCLWFSLLAKPPRLLRGSEVRVR